MPPYVDAPEYDEIHRPSELPERRVDTSPRRSHVAPSPLDAVTPAEDAARSFGALSETLGAIQPRGATPRESHSGLAGSRPHHLRPAPRSPATSPTPAAQRPVRPHRVRGSPPRRIISPFRMVKTWNRSIETSIYFPTTRTLPRSAAPGRPDHGSRRVDRPTVECPPGRHPRTNPDRFHSGEVHQAANEAGSKSISGSA